MKALKLIGIFALTTPALAFGDGGSDEGCCGVPTTFERDVLTLRESMEGANVTTIELLQRQFAGTLCEHFDCGGLSEDQASRFLDRLNASTQQEQDSKRASVNTWLAAGALLVGLLGLLLSAFAIWRTPEGQHDD